MTQTLIEPQTSPQIGRALALRTLEVMVLTRFMDDKCFKLSRQNKGGTFQLSVAGHELIGTVAALSLIPGKDWRRRAQTNWPKSRRHKFARKRRIFHNVNQTQAAIKRDTELNLSTWWILIINRNLFTIIRVHQSVQNAHSVLARIACTVGCASCTLSARVARPRTLFVIFETFHPSETNFRQFFEDIAL